MIEKSEYILNNLTLIIPSYNRQEYLLRILHYWSNRGVVVHVVDGSDVSITQEKLGGLGDNINYHYLPIPVIDRLKYALDLPKTIFTALMADDEFYIPSALIECINELENDSELVSCIGRCLAFKWSGHEVRGYMDVVDQANYQLLENDPFERMYRHMSDYTPSTIYSVTRTFEWINLMRIAIDTEYPVYSIGERLFELCNAFIGKSKVIPTLMWLRSKETEPIRGTDISLDPDNHFYRWFLRDVNEEREELLDFLSVELSAFSTLNEQTIRDMLFEAMDAHAAWNQMIIEEANVSNIKVNVLRFRHILPGFVRQWIRTLRKQYGNQRIEDVQRDMVMNGVEVDEKELGEIVKCIEKFHSETNSAPDTN